jgi:hypothetical protein
MGGSSAPITDLPTTEVVLEEAHRMSPREVFLLEVYKQCSAHLNRHVSSIWQCIAVLVAAGATLGLDKTTPLLDYAVSAALLSCAWFAAMALDASAWFNRNISIITNVERLFLAESDVRLVHPFFAMEHKPDRLIQQLHVQLLLGGSIAGLLLLFHASHRTFLPVSCSSLDDGVRFLPWLVTATSLAYLRRVWVRQVRQQREIDRLSPGRDMGVLPPKTY